MWATRDNGSDIEWYDAERYCEDFAPMRDAYRSRALLARSVGKMEPLEQGAVRDGGVGKDYGQRDNY